MRAGGGSCRWTKLLRKVLQALQAAVGRVHGDGAAGVQWVEVSPRRAGVAAVAETGRHRRGAGVLVRRGGGSLDLKCYCFNALTDEGMQGVSRLTALTSLELWRCSKVTEEGSA
jgi:hypothetical protein